MYKLSLALPGGYQVFQPTGFRFQTGDAGADPAALVSAILQLGIYVAFVLAMSWLAWGVFQYIVAGGNKENLARARARITWAIVGLVIVLITWSLSRLVGEIFSPTNVPVTPVSTPP